MKKNLLNILAVILLLSAVFVFVKAVSPQTTQTTTKSVSLITSAATTEKVTAQSTYKTETSSAKTTTKKATETTSKAKTSSKDTTTKTTAAKKSTTKKATTKAATKAEKQTQTKAKKSCYITVECKSILNNMDKLKEGHEDFVPKNGIIIGKTKCTFKKGESVYDVLKKTCNNKGVKLSSRSTAYGVYVSGINNLDEFDCGKQSGWVYTVNGSSPSFSCGKYTVSNGDEIIFKYVC